MEMENNITKDCQDGKPLEMIDERHLVELKAYTKKQG